MLPQERDLQHAAEILNEGEKVAILAGQGARGAAAELEQAADLLGAGVAKALLGKDVLPDDLPYVTGSVGLRTAGGGTMVRRLIRNIRDGRMQRLLAAATALSAPPLAFEIYLEHYKASFGDRWMWTPIYLTPPLTAAGIAGFVSPKAARTALPFFGALYALDGLFYETDERRGFARGFSIQTISPLPIGWAEHVVAEGHWGESLREYMRDYNHWTVLGSLCELLPQPENRVTLASQKDQFGMPIACFQHSLCDNDKKNIAFATKVMCEIWEGAGAEETMTIDRYAHLVGGCRMGFSPEDSVVDSTHRAWGVRNLFVCDGSVMPTQGAANPALAIMALADRLAKLLEDKRAHA